MNEKGNVALLRLMNLPVFSNVDELSSMIHVDSRLVESINANPRRFYKRYKIPKSNGEQREIRQPNRMLKGIQAWILRNILDNLSPSIFATAYIKGKNTVSNVIPHSNNRYFLCLDMEDFFPSISIRRVKKVFSLIGYSDKASLILANLCTCDGNLPQGAVTSPSLSNLIASKLDRRIAGYTSRRNIAYTRYADDITLSSNNPSILNKSLPMVLKIIKSEHFKPNMDKLRILGPKKKCRITGLVKNTSESTFGIGKKQKKHMRAVMHHYIYGLEPDKKYSGEEAIVGWLNYLKNVDRKSYNQMYQYWEDLKTDM